MKNIISVIFFAALAYLTGSILMWIGMIFTGNMDIAELGNKFITNLPVTGLVAVLFLKREKLLKEENDRKNYNSGNYDEDWQFRR